MRFPRFILFALLPVLTLVGVAEATIVVRVTVEDLTEKATVVIRGQVLDAKARWTDDERTIRTYVRIRVDETLKGDAGAEVIITCPGGEVGKDRMKIHGVPKFKVGEQVVVFAWKNKDGEFLPLGLNQGKFLIEKDKETGEEIAKNSLEGLALATARTPKTKAEREALKNADSLPLTDLRRRIRTHLVKMEEEAKKAESDDEAESTAEDGDAAGKGHETAEPSEEKTGKEEKDPESGPAPRKKRP